MDLRRIARVGIPVAAVSIAGAALAPTVVRSLSGANDSSDSAAESKETPSSISTSTQSVPNTTDFQASRRTYTNPVFAENAPDPSVVRGEDGAFYAYTTESAWLPFQVLRSENLTDWTRIGGAFEGTGPTWVKEHRWAPDVKRTGDHFTMLYSGRGFDGQMRIGYATSPSASGPFTDRGVLIDSAGSAGYVIDPYLAKTQQGWKVYYGSSGGTQAADQTGISSIDVAISPDGSMTTTGSSKVVLSENGERELVEGAWLHERDGSYYLFYSDGLWDAKGSSQDYAVKVARSSTPDGPFEKLGSPVLEQGSGYTGTGHNAIVTDDAGQDWILYHGWGPDPSKGRVLMLDPITWKDGWPVVNQGKGPSTGALDGPIIQANTGRNSLTS